MRATSDRRVELSFSGTPQLAAAILGEEASMMVVAFGSPGSAGRRLRMIEATRSGAVWRVGASVEPAGLNVLPGLSATSDERHERIWFAARPRHAASRIYLMERARGRRVWSEPKEVLRPADEAEAAGLVAPAALVLDGTSYLWYTIVDGGKSVIRLAHSRDGRDWQRSGTVLGHAQLGQPDDLGASQPAVVPMDEYLLMAYCGGSGRSLLLATSSDGARWERHGHGHFAGPPGTGDSAAVSHPAWSRSDSGIRLYYAGHGECGPSSIMSCAADLVLDRLDFEEYMPAADTVAAMSRTLDDLRDDQLELRLSARKAAVRPYVSQDGAVEQLFPSSTPVFLVASGDRRDVVKLGRSSHFVEREFDRGTALRAHFPVVPSTIRYVDGRALLVTPWIDAETGAAVASSDRDRFHRVAGRIAAATGDALRRTVRPYDGSIVDFSTQTPALVLARLDRLAEGLPGHPLSKEVLASPRLNQQPLMTSLASAAAAASIEVGLPPRWLVYFEGDFKLEHVLVPSEGEPFVAIDSEYAGWFDLEWIVHTLLFAFVAESGATTGAGLGLNEGELAIDVPRFRDCVPPTLRSGDLFALLSELPIDYGRVLAYHVAAVAELLLSGHPERVQREALACYALCRMLLAERGSSPRRPLAAQARTGP